MAYTWTTGEVITANKLNNTGGGNEFNLFIVTAVYDETQNTWTVDKTINEVLSVFSQRPVMYILRTNENGYYHSYTSSKVATTDTHDGIMCTVIDGTTDEGLIIGSDYIHDANGFYFFDDSDVQ